MKRSGVCIYSTVNALVVSSPNWLMTRTAILSCEDDGNSLNPKIHGNRNPIAQKTLPYAFSNHRVGILSECLHFSVAPSISCGRLKAMTVAVETPKKQKFSRVSMEAGDRLLKAIKEKLLREKGRIDCAVLRRKGYSEALIARLKEV